MPRYVIMDRYTDNVWALTEAPNVVEACRNMDQLLGIGDKRYHAITMQEAQDERFGYQLHHAPDSYALPEDASNWIARQEVKSFPSAGFVKCVGLI